MQQREIDLLTAIRDELTGTATPASPRFFPAPGSFPEPLGREHDAEPPRRGQAAPDTTDEAREMP